MSLMNMLVTLVIAGVVLWVVNEFIQMDAKVKRILNIVAIAVLVLWLLNAFGLFDALHGVRVPRM